MILKSQQNSIELVTRPVPYLPRLDANSRLAPRKKPRLRASDGGNKQRVGSAVRWPLPRGRGGGGPLAAGASGGGGASRHDNAGLDYDYVDTTVGNDATVLLRNNRNKPGSVRHLNNHLPKQRQKPRRRLPPPQSAKNVYGFRNRQTALRQQSPVPNVSKNVRLRRPQQHTRRGDFDNTQFYSVRGLELLTHVIPKV